LSLSIVCINIIIIIINILIVLIIFIIIIIIIIIITIIITIIIIIIALILHFFLRILELCTFLYLNSIFLLSNFFQKVLHPNIFIENSDDTLFYFFLPHTPTHTNPPTHTNTNTHTHTHVCVCMCACVCVCVCVSDFLMPSKLISKLLVLRFSSKTATYVIKKRFYYHLIKVLLYF
jgi:hypothetical protein